ncbi:SDR family NAD(P)-dependent oxidoreductase [Spirochaetota bacterium]
MKHLKGKKIIITGAASGIGRELAFKLAQKNAIVIICDYNNNALMETTDIIKNSGGEVYSKFIDIKNRDKVFNWTQNMANQFNNIDILINNAGIAGKTSDINILTFEEIENIINTNLWGTINCTLSLLPLLKKSNDASIVNISSLAGLTGILGALPYSISKFAIRGFTESLRMELMETTISVIQVHPGVVKTNIIKNIPEFSLSDSVKSHNAFMKQKGVSAGDAAHTIINGIMRGKKRILIGKDALIIDIISRLFPEMSSKMLYPKMKKIIEKLK